MKQLYGLIGAAALALLIFPGASSAQATIDLGARATTTAKIRGTTTRLLLPENARVRTEVRTRIDAQRDEIRAKVEERRADIKAKMDDRTRMVRAKFAELSKQKTQALVDRIEKRLNHAVDVLNGIADRLDARIKKLEERGKVMTESKAALAVALGKIAEAQAAVNKIAGVVDATLATGANATSTAKAAIRVKFKDVREAVRAAEDAIKAAKKSLQEVIQKIRLEAGAEAEANITASSSPR